MANANVAIGVDHILLGQDSIRDDQIADRAFQLVHAALSFPNRKRLHYACK